MAFWRSKSNCVLVVLCALYFFRLEAVIIECEDEEVIKTIKPSDTGIAHASFCAEIRPPPEPYAEIPSTEGLCFTHHLCAEHYFWWWESTEHEADIYTIHLQLRNLGKQDRGEFPITIFTNRYQESRHFAVVVSDEGDESEGDPKSHKEPTKIEECADAEAEAEAETSAWIKCPSGWYPVGDGLCLLNELGDPVNYPLAKDSCAIYGATLVKMEKTEDVKRRRRRRETEEGEEDGEDEDYYDDDDEKEEEEGDYDDDEDGQDGSDYDSDEEPQEGMEDDGEDEEEPKEEKSDRESLDKEKDQDDRDSGEKEKDSKGIKEGDEDDEDDPDEGKEDSESDHWEKMKEGDDEDDGGDNFDDSIQEGDEEDDVEDLEKAEREKGQESRAKDDGKRFTNIERVFMEMEKADNYAIGKCLNARLTALAGDENLWVLDEEDELSCITYNSVEKLVREERTCHYLYNRFTCMLDTRRYQKPTISKFHLQFRYGKGHHKNVDLSVTKQRMAYHEVKDGVTHAILSCEAVGWPTPEVVIVEEGYNGQPTTLHESPYQHNFSESGGALLGKFSCLATNLFGDEAMLTGLQLWRYDPPHRVRLITSGVLILILLIMVVVALIIMNRYKVFRKWGRCHSHNMCSCNCLHWSRRRPTGASRVPTEMFPASQDYVYGDVWADEVPLYERQARVRTTSNSGPVYKNCTEEK